jgi:hypothetical protein
MEVKEMVEALAKVVREVGFANVTAERAKRDLGVDHLGVFVVSSDPYLLSLWDGKEITPNAWFGSLNEAATLTVKP